MIAPNSHQVVQLSASIDRTLGRLKAMLKRGLSVLASPMILPWRKLKFSFVSIAELGERPAPGSEPVMSFDSYLEQLPP